MCCYRFDCWSLSYTHSRRAHVLSILAVLAEEIVEINPQRIPLLEALKRDKTLSQFSSEHFS